MRIFIGPSVGGRANLCLSIRPYPTSFSGNLRISFFWNFVKSERSGFSSKTHVCPKTVKQGSKCTQNRILRIFHKFCYHFLMEGTSIERPYNFLFCYANPVSGKNLYCQVMTKMSNQIAWFFDHQYLWKECIDILFFYMEIFIKER